MSRSDEPPDNLQEYSSYGDATDFRASLQNLSSVKQRMDSLRHFLWESLTGNPHVARQQMDAISSELASAIHQTVRNGFVLVSCARSDRMDWSAAANLGATSGPGENQSLASDVVQLDAAQLLSERSHLCDIWGKGFKRDANLRMHMRAHGDHFKTPEFPSKQRHRVADDGKTKARFSCPYEGCNRNKNHSRFMSPGSVAAARKHFKRSHSPKLHLCHVCRKRSFAVMADLKSHAKHCGEAAAARWRCPCSTSLRRKDEGESEADHTTAAAGAKNDGGDEVEAPKEGLGFEPNCTKDGLFEGLFDGLDSMEDDSCLQEILGCDCG